MTSNRIAFGIVLMAALAIGAPSFVQAHDRGRDDTVALRHDSYRSFEDHHRYRERDRDRHDYRHWRRDDHRFHYGSGLRYRAPEFRAAPSYRYRYAPHWSERGDFSATPRHRFDD